MNTRWLCRLIGHKPDHDHQCDVFVCRYCGGCEYDDDFPYDPWHVDFIRRSRFWLHVRCWRLKRRVACEHCGKLFGRHDASIDHDPMPF
jgi:hypothetical protein